MRVYKKNHLNANQDEINESLDLDDVIVGSGAGGGHLAFKLSNKERRVLVIESGKLKQSKDFVDDELNSYQNLYQEQLSRTSSDKKIKILQGHAVGGSTTINWTSSFRTPDSTLEYWIKEFDIKLDLDDHFEKVEEIYGIQKWEGPINKNNQLLQKVCEKQNWSFDRISRNVNGCASTGLCGFGCPINAKQSTLVNTLPRALKNGVQLISELKVEKLITSQNKIVKLIAKNKSGKLITVKAKRFFLCAGSIGTPAIMLRSELKDPYQLIGKRTFLHPTLMSAYISNEYIEGAKGAPQTIYSNQFLEDGMKSDTMGFKLEVAPIHPVLYSSVFDNFGEDHLALMKMRPYVSAQLILLRDGFHPESQGGTVHLNKYGLPSLDYPQNDFLRKAAHRSMSILCEAQLNSGAKSIYPGVYHGREIKSLVDTKKLLDEKKDLIKIFSAHVMGGAPMGTDFKKSMINTNGQSHYYSNLYVMDGSLFPTSIGANPMESIYGLVDYMSDQL